MNINAESSSAMPWLFDPQFGGMTPESAEISYRASQRRREEEAAWDLEQERLIAERTAELVNRWEANDPRDRPASPPPSPNGPADYGTERQRAKQIGPRMDELPLTIEQWRARDLPEPDFICGKWLSTTSRVLISAPTGLGKSNLVIALGQHIGAGLPFLHWNATRPAKVLYVDGEMSRRLLRQRIFAEADRHGGDLGGFYALSHEDVERFAPFNTLQGQAWVLALIERLGVDLVIFDNIMSLTQGDQTNELVWQQTMPLVLALTQKSVGQLWVHHTGHDETKGYGTKTREWSLDTVCHLEEVKLEDTDVSFTLVFKKARERTPLTRRDFQTVRIALVNDRWEHDVADVVTLRPGKVSPQAKKALGALIDVLAGDQVTLLPGNRRAAHRDDWASECHARGVIDRGKADSARILLSRHRRDLVAANRIACEGDFSWLIA